MARIPLASAENLTPEQQRVYDAIVGTRGGRLTAPYRVTLLHSPVVTDKWQQLGGVLRNCISLPSRLAELAIIVTAHCRDCPYVWQAHAPLALAAGVSAETVDAIKTGGPQVSAKPDEQAIHDFCVELCRTNTVDAGTYSRALDLFGATQLVELTALAGYYTMVTMALNAHDYDLPLPAQA